MWQYRNLWSGLLQELYLYRQAGGNGKHVSLLSAERLSQCHTTPSLFHLALLCSPLPRIYHSFVTTGSLRSAMRNAYFITQLRQTVQHSQGCACPEWHFYQGIVNSYRYCASVWLFHDPGWFYCLPSWGNIPQSAENTRASLILFHWFQVNIMFCDTMH